MSEGNFFDEKCTCDHVRGKHAAAGCQHPVFHAGHVGPCRCKLFDPKYVNTYEERKAEAIRIAERLGFPAPMIEYLRLPELLKAVAMELFMIGESSPDAAFIRSTLKVLNATGDLSK